MPYRETDEEEFRELLAKRSAARKEAKSRRIIDSDYSDDDLPATDSELVDNKAEGDDSRSEKMDAEEEGDAVSVGGDIKLERSDSAGELDNRAVLASKVAEKKGRGRKKKDKNLLEDVLLKSAAQYNGRYSDERVRDEDASAAAEDAQLADAADEKLAAVKSETSTEDEECLEHNYFAPTALKRQVSRQASQVMLAEATHVYVPDVDDDTPTIEENEPMMPTLPEDGWISHDHQYCVRLRPSSGDIPDMPPDLSHLWYDVPSPSREGNDDFECSAPIRVDVGHDVNLGEQVNIVATDADARRGSEEYDEGEETEEEAVVQQVAKKKRGRPPASDRFSRELASLLPQPKAKRKFPERSLAEETNILRGALRNGIDEEDIWLLQRCYDQLHKQVEGGSTSLAWLSDIEWVEHPATLVHDAEPARKRRRGGGYEELPRNDRHVTGSARTEGYYKISHKDKITYMKHAHSLVEAHAVESETQVVSSDWLIWICVSVSVPMIGYCDWSMVVSTCKQLP